MRWKPHVDRQGKNFPLNHLHPFRFTLTLDCGEIIVSVGFAMHCFTKKSDANDDPSDCYRDEREQRTFCHERYALSRLLPNILRTLPERQCEFARNDNFVTFDTVSLEGRITKYGIFFNIKRWTDGRRVAGIQLTVQSAYSINPGKSSPGKGKIKFVRAVELILDGIKPKPPHH